MNFLKRALAVSLAAVLCLSAAGCSGADKSWAVKDSSNNSVPIGCYVYSLYSAYSMADSKKPDASKDVLSQKIENKDAKTWIRDKALTSTKLLLFLDQKMKSMKLTLTDADKKMAQQMNSSAWAQASSVMEKYGVAQSSFETVYGTAFMKEKKIFDATYGKSGTKAVPDTELKDYYLKNYSDFSFILCSLYNTDASGNATSAMTDAQKKKAESVLNDYATQIKAGKLTMRKAADSYKALMKSSSDELHTASANLATETNYPEAMRTTLKGMKTGEVKTLEIGSQGIYLLLSKGDSAKAIETTLKTEDARENLLLNYKSNEFLPALEKDASAAKGISVNDAALNSYDPKMFVASASSAAAPAK